LPQLAYRFEGPDHCRMTDIALHFDAGIAHPRTAQPVDAAAGVFPTEAARDFGAIHVAGSLAGDHQELRKIHGNGFFNSRNCGRVVWTSTDSCQTRSKFCALPMANSLYVPKGTDLNSNFPSAPACFT